MREKAGLYGRAWPQNCQGSGLAVRKRRGAREANKTGMFMKRKDMPICDRPIKVWEREDVEDSASGGGWAKQTQEA